MIWLKQLVSGLAAGREDHGVGPIGLEMGLAKAHLVQLETAPDGQTAVRAAASFTYPDPRDRLLASPRTLKGLFNEALKSHPFQGRRVVTAVPPSHVKTLSVSYQVAAGQSNDAAVAQLMTRRLEGQVSDYVIDYLPVRDNRGDEGRLAMVAVARREWVIGYLESLRKAGLEVQALDIGPAAIKRLVTAMSGGEMANVLVVNCGRAMSYFTVISGRRLLFDQQIDFGEQHLLQEVAEALDVSPEHARDLLLKHGLDEGDSTEAATSTADEAEITRTLREILTPKFMSLVDEINRALIFTASETHGEPVRRAYLLGSIARWAGAGRLLNELVSIPVESPDPFCAFESRPPAEVNGEAAPPSELAVATGLALRGMDGYA